MKTDNSSRIGKIIALVFLLALLPIVIVLVQIQQDYRQHAATGVELYAIASTSQVTSGQELSYDVDIDTKNYLVDSVDLRLTYPADKLIISSIHSDDTVFETETEHIAGNGLIALGRSTTSPVSGKKRILTIIFHAIAPTSYDVLQPGAGMSVKSQKQNITTGTIVTDKAIPVTNTEDSSFSFSTMLQAFFHLFGRK